MTTRRTIHVSIGPRSKRLQGAPHSRSKVVPVQDEEQYTNRYSSSTIKTLTIPAPSSSHPSLSTKQSKRSHRRSIDLLFAVDLAQITSKRHQK